MTMYDGCYLVGMFSKSKDHPSSFVCDVKIVNHTFGLCDGDNVAASGMDVLEYQYLTSTFTFITIDLMVIDIVC